MNKKRNSILQRATLWGAALSLAGCMVAVPRAAAQDQDDQQITPSQSDSQSMQQPDYNNQQGTYSSQGTYNQGQQGTYTTGVGAPWLNLTVSSTLIHKSRRTLTGILP
jgi:hypothetical protein